MSSEHAAQVGGNETLSWFQGQWDHATLSEGVVIDNRFRLVRLLAEGGMGSLWIADHVTLGSRCALKFIEGSALGDERARARFEMEARTAAKVSGPHVVAIIERGTFAGTPYIAMDLLEGKIWLRASGG